MEKKKLELITLFVISLVVVFVVLFTFVFNIEESSFPVTSVVVALGLLTYMLFSMLSFKRFNGIIDGLSEKLLISKKELEQKNKELTALQETHDAVLVDLNEKKQTIQDLEKKLAVQDDEEEPAS